MTVSTPHTDMPRFRLPVYEGPLDLLLQLIRENEVDIYDIPIAQITRQYLDRLAEWQALDLVLAGDYLVMAATLVEIKSRMLLPAPPRQDEIEVDPREALVAQLLEYQRYTGAAETLRDWEAFRASLYFRNATEIAGDYILPMEQSSLTGRDLHRAFLSVLSAAGVPEAPVSAVVPRRRVSLRVKMAEILRAVHGAAEGLPFESILSIETSRADCVLVFLAMLELIRIGRINAVQRGPFGDIQLVARTDGGGDPAAAAESISDPPLRSTVSKASGVGA